MNVHMLDVDAGDEMPGCECSMCESYEDIDWGREGR